MLVAFEVVLELAVEVGDDVGKPRLLLVHAAVDGLQLVEDALLVLVARVLLRGDLLHELQHLVLV